MASITTCGASSGTQWPLSCARTCRPRADIRATRASASSRRLPAVADEITTSGRFAVIGWRDLQDLCRAVTDGRDLAAQRLEELRLRPRLFEDAARFGRQLPDRREDPFVLAAQPAAADHPDHRPGGPERPEAHERGHRARQTALRRDRAVFAQARAPRDENLLRLSGRRPFLRNGRLDQHQSCNLARDGATRTGASRAPRTSGRPGCTGAARPPRAAACAVHPRCGPPSAAAGRRRSSRTRPGRRRRHVSLVRPRAARGSSSVTIRPAPRRR